MIAETKAVVLHAMKYRDTSRIVTLYTQRYGKIKVVAKGVRNPKTNTFGSSLEPMTVSRVVLYKHEHRDLHLLSKSEIALPLNHLQEDSEKMYAGLAMVELTNAVLHDEEENQPLFSLLVEALATVDGAVKNSISTLFSFMIKVFGFLGFGMNLAQCDHCGKKTEGAVYRTVVLRLSNGTYVCPSCSAEKDYPGVTLSGSALKCLYYLQINTIEQSVSLALQPPVRDELLTLMQSYARYHVDGMRTIRSFSLLQNI